MKQVIYYNDLKGIIYEGRSFTIKGQVQCDKENAERDRINVVYGHDTINDKDVYFIYDVLSDFNKLRLEEIVEDYLLN